MDSSSGGVTVSVVLPLIVSRVAVMVVAPWAREVARPVGLTVATVVLLLDQIARLVIFSVLASS